MLRQYGKGGGIKKILPQLMLAQVNFLGLEERLLEKFKLSERRIEQEIFTARAVTIFIDAEKACYAKSLIVSEISTGSAGEVREVPEPTAEMRAGYTLSRLRSAKNKALN